MAELFGGSLADQRVGICEADVGELIRSGPSTYDAILLDVDNGPEGLSRRINDDLYSDYGLDAAMRALKPGGFLAIWSCGPDPSFTRRLEDAGFEVSVAKVRERPGNRGAFHVIWFAQRPDA